jgi:hypothetical protein
MDSNGVNIPINVDTSSLDALNAKINSITAELTKAGGVSNDEFKRLNSELAATTKQMNDLDKSVAVFNEEVGKTKSLKSQYRESQAEVAALSEKFGETSKQALEAAKKTALLKDAIEDAKMLTDSFNPDNKFVALTGSLKGAVAGFELATGAQALFGQESENALVVIKKLQGAMALSKGIEDITQATKSFKILGAQIQQNSLFQKANAAATSLAAGATKLLGLSTEGASGGFKGLKAAIIGTGIGAIVVAVGLLIANFDKVKQVVMNLFPGLAGLGKLIGGLIDSITDFFGITTEKGRALDKMIEDSEKSLGKQEGWYERNSYKYDEFTKKKMEANLSYSKSILDVNKALKDSTITEAEAAQQRKELAGKLNYEIDQADKGRGDKVKEDAKKSEEEAKKIKDKAIADAKKREEDRKKEVQRKAAYDKQVQDISNQLAVDGIKDKFEKETKLEELRWEDAKKSYKTQKDEGKLKDDEYKKLIEQQEKLHTANLKKIKADSDAEVIKTKDDLAVAVAKTDDEKYNAERQKIIDETELKIKEVKKGSDAELLIKAEAQVRLDKLDEDRRVKDEAKRQTHFSNLISEDEFVKSNIEKEVVNNEDKFNRLSEINKKIYDDKVSKEDDSYKEQVRIATAAGQSTEEIDKSHKLTLRKFDEEYTESNISLAQRRQEAQIVTFDAISNASNILSDILGKDTLAGKALAVASATINTYTAITGQLKAFSGVPIPGYAIIQAIATGIQGFAAVSKILQVNVPAKSGGSGGSGGGTGTLPQNTTFAAPQIFGIGGAQIKDFKQSQDQKVIVTENDLTRVHNRVDNIRKASVQGG